MASLKNYYSFFKSELQQFDTGPILNNLNDLVEALDQHQDISKEDKEKAKTLVFDFLHKAHPSVKAMKAELNNCVVEMSAIGNKSIDSLIVKFVDHYRQEQQAVDAKLPSFLNFK